MALRITITLLRHGLTDYNEQKRYLGWTDVPLNQKGYHLLDSTKQNYSYLAPEVIISSDLKRCVDTAKTLFPNVPIKQSKSLREIDFGGWEGKTYEELKDDLLYKKWLENQTVVTPPHGEAYIQFQKRVLEGWNKVVVYALEQQLNHITIMSHGGPIRFILSQCSSTNKGFWDWNIGYGQGYSLVTDEDKMRRGERWNLLQEAPLMENEAGFIHTIK
ncbi:hypothetical protein BTR23_01020 [Alkalihalophilus pseudofirmus]|nr:hypothetical protein BTR23_01020 [Alkalihalophilus pseudofirmus]